MPLNKNLEEILKAYNSGKRGIVLEGSSRSGKTISALDFFFSYAVKIHRPTTVNFIKETYSGFKTTLYNDFNWRLPYFGLRSPTETVREVPSFNIYDTKFNMMGADQPSKYHGAGSDFFYINEALTVPKSIFDQLEMRCNYFWIMDYNPSVSDHWIFNLEKRSDVVFVHSTILDNPHIPYPQKLKILSYEPTPTNIEAGTADDFMWKVYGLGLRASPQGVIFPNVEWIDSFPTDIDQIAYGMDFGHTNSPTTIVKCGKNGKNLYFESLFYTPCDNTDELSQILAGILGDEYVCADSAEPGMISEIRRNGIAIAACKKFPGSIKFGIDFLKSHKIHLVRNVNVRKEQENYHWKTINGIALNDPIDDFNHFWDAARYGSVASFRHD
jgi:phage terminase large subunit